ncbi:MAG: class GN sortase [Parvibaculum sp.]|uniref:class GN sortase n=1 Tax=Parvibaculum sp. TaxID=2024848 RepID=UPI003297F8F9
MKALTANKAGVLWTAAILLCVGLGAWQLGQGLYIMAKAELAQVLLERAWAKTLEDGKPHKAWSWADTWPVAKIEFPSLGESRIVLSNTSGEALAFGPGHLLGSPLPGGNGTSVIAGHRDTHFSLLRDLKNDDIVIVTSVDGIGREYKIRESKVVLADNSRIDPSAAAGLVLVTCYPFDARERGPLRYAVFANESPDAI